MFLLFIIHVNAIVIVLQSKTVCLQLRTVGTSVFWFNFVRCPCNVFDTITIVSP